MNEDQVALLEQSIGERPAFSERDLTPESTIIQQLRNYYAKKYPTQEDAIQVLSLLNIPYTSVDLTGSALAFWYQIFRELNNTGNMKIFLENEPALKLEPLFLIQAKVKHALVRTL